MSEKPSATSDDFSPELYRVARRLVWWRPPEEALHDRIRFAAQVMNLGTWRDIQTLSRSWGEGVFAKVLDHPPPGVFGPRRWNYWHIRLRRSPIPKLPIRFAA